MENKRQFQLRVTRGCMIAGQAFSEGALIEVDDAVAHDALREGVAKFEDEETAKRLRTRPYSGWVDRENDERPKIRLVKTA
jgi:hypothetical protein